jgi:hypothetical protein
MLIAASSECAGLASIVQTLVREVPHFRLWLTTASHPLHDQMYHPVAVGLVAKVDALSHINTY